MEGKTRAPAGEHYTKVVFTFENERVFMSGVARVCGERIQFRSLPWMLIFVSVKHRIA